MALVDKYNIRTLAEYQRSMDVFEVSQDGLTLPDVRILLRVDAHRFGPEWENEPDEDYPFGKKFVSALHEVALVLMGCGLKTSFAYMHGDEVSLLLADSESNNSRRRSRLISIASSAAAAGFQKAFGKPALFYTRMAELPNPTRMIDYFMWQRKVATRNFLSRSLGLLLQADGKSEQETAAIINPLDENARRDLLRDLGRAPETCSPYEFLGAAYWWEFERNANKPDLVSAHDLPQADEDYLKLLIAALETSAFAAPESLALISVRPPNTTGAAGFQNLRSQAPRELPSRPSPLAGTAPPPSGRTSTGFRVGNPGSSFRIAPRPPKKT